MILFYEAIRFLKELHKRNNVFFYLGVGLVILFMIFLSTFTICQHPVYKICSWLKPFKFALTFAIYVASLGWYMEYLKTSLGERWIKCLSWVVSILILSEMGITLMQSLLTSDTGIDQHLYILGNLIIVTNTAVATYIGLQFFRKISIKPISYLWGIRSGFIIFILSGVLGAFILRRYGQTPPNPDQYGIPFTNFSSVRDILVSLHFLGIHSLQLLPLCCYFFQKHVGKIFILSSIGTYAIVCMFFILKA